MTQEIVIEDNLYATAHGMTHVVDACLSFKGKGYNFSSAFKRFKESGGEFGWDGVTHLAKVGENGIRFPRGLVQYVLDHAIGMGIEPTVTDLRTVPKPSIITFRSKPPDDMTPEEHQEDAIDAAIQQGQGIIYYPTGSGKSVVIGEIVRRIRVPTLVLVDKKDLLQQLHTALEHITGAPVGRIGGGIWESGLVTVATVQSLGQKLHPPKAWTPKMKKAAQAQVMEFLSHFEHVMCDETHHSEASTFVDVLKGCVNAYYRFGFSATPFKGEDVETLLGVMSWLGPVASYLSISRGIETGRIVPADVWVTAYKTPIVPKAEIPDNYVEERDRLLINCDERNDVVLRIAERVRLAGPTIVLVESIEHGEYLSETLKSAFVHGGLTSTERKATWEAFRRGETDLLVVSKIGDEGLDLPNIQFLILAAGGKAAHRQIQRIGRALRASEGKTHGTIFDFADKWGKYLPKHYRSRRRAYEGEPAYNVGDLTAADLEALF